ncbi:MAG: oxygen-independent coproporphyrinogen III oxidase [Rhizomicrobium sp.]
MMNLSDLLSARVPRYTSYPTAPHFSAAVDAAVYADWLGRLPPGQPLSLYVHVPFCDTLCWFCGCHTSVVNHYAPVGAYLDTLLAEIELLAAKIGPDHPVTHLHWGGGSPTILSPEHIARLTGALRRHFPFTPDAEFAVEIDPRDLTDASIAAMAEAGVNRASIGVQDESATVQRAINRIQPHEVTQSAIGRLRAAGISGINIDLIYGLPHQGEAEVAATVARTLELKPQRFAVFGYAHVPHFKKHMELIRPEALAGAEARLRQYELAHRLLCAGGYVPVGLDHFSRPDDGLAKELAAGKLMRNFQGYTDDGTPALIGLGASSIGALPQGYVQNIAPVPEYRKQVEAGLLPVARGVALSDEDRLRGAIIERLMCDLAVDLDAVAAPFGKSSADFRDALERLQPLCEAGFIHHDHGRLSVPPEARFGVRLAAAAFDAYLPRGGAVHSVAV